ncbi:hypothetical protein SAMN04489842_2133 [Natronobacterium texcoconense]|uniref:Uncharacterized protein n=1 Tax=Natronobacterium texcoconense TaxID=1095778 RepID=A0A1H1FW69_NATTX|nr:hypothetical protein SAMN04489842_2133 [Natronobacterium texcoconense]
MIESGRLRDLLGFGRAQQYTQVQNDVLIPAHNR